MTDQVLSSASNVLAVVLVARASGAADFGRFALAYAALTMAVSVNRAYLGNRISLSTSNQGARESAALVVGGLLAIGPVLMAVVWLVGRLISGGGPLVLVVALAAPVVCLQDLLRYGAVASGQPLAALLSDGLWTACLALPLVLQVHLEPWQAVTAWAAGAVLSAVVALLCLRLRPRVRAGWREIRRRDAVGGSLVFGRLVTSSASLLVVAASAAIINPAAAGALRGASTLMGPLNGIFALVPLSLTPALVRRRRSGDAKACVAVSLALLGVVLCLGAVLLVIPPAMGEKLLGASWSGARTVLPFTVAEYACISVTTAVLLASKVRGAARSIALQQGVLAVMSVLAGVGAALFTHQARYVAAGLVVASASSALTGALTLRGSRPRTGRVTRP